jgi:hypothetical protein
MNGSQGRGRQRGRVHELPSYRHPRVDHIRLTIRVIGDLRTSILEDGIHSFIGRGFPLRRDPPKDAVNAIPRSERLAGWAGHRELCPVERGKSRFNLSDPRDDQIANLRAGVNTELTHNRVFGILKSESAQDK